ncbi:MAG: cob(I)yrinic acid a,c-diamide adenosyltransferase [Clostridiales bacterium]|nr:cob(I)yrinic acid a,c-diamide adenosyltransferase [Clostridiales bacterium]
MIHIYFGEGKGKTTAATGLAARAAGSGMKVLFVQFFKDGSSGEVKSLKALENITFLYPDTYNGRYATMTEDQKEITKKSYTEAMKKAIAIAKDADLIILDEAVSVFTYGFIDRDELLSFLRDNREKKEIVLTGRDPARQLLELADYATEMRKHRHPFDRGIAAREGIEY